MDAIRTRFTKFTTPANASASAARRYAIALLFEQFLLSRASGGSQRVQTAQPSDIVEFLCWLDACEPRRRTPVHAVHYSAVGTSTLDSCSTKAGDCALRYAPESLRTNNVSKNSVFYERDIGVVSDWSDNLRTGNPARSTLVTSYMAFSREEQKRAGVTVKQAPTLLSSHLRALAIPMRVRLCCTEDPYTRALLARDIALFTTAFRTTKRGDELSRTLIHRIQRLPNEGGLLFNFQWGKTLRSGADHLLTVSYDQQCWATCPVRAVEQFVATGTASGWDMTKGYLFLTISPGKSVVLPVRGSRPVSAPQMTTALKAYAVAAGERGEYSMHFFRSAGAISQVLAGENLQSIMQRAFWKQPSTAWRYLRLVQVVAPGTSVSSMVKGVSEDEFCQMNEFPLSELSRSWATFGT